MVLARTLKGKGLSAIEGKDGWHGKALKKGKETDDAIAELEKQFVPGAPKPVIQPPPVEEPSARKGRLREAAEARVQARRSGRDARGVGRGACGRRHASTSASSRSMPT